MPMSTQTNIHVRDTEVSPEVHIHGYFTVLTLNIGKAGDGVKFFVNSVEEVEALAKSILVAAASAAAKAAAAEVAEAEAASA